MIKQKNRSSRHKLIIALATMFIFIAALITAVGLIIAFPRQGLEASVKISYTALGIDGEVSATWQVGETIENMKTSTGETSIVFKSSDEEATGTLSPLDEENKNKIIQLSSTNDFVEFVYTFKNYGKLTYTVIMDYTDYANDNITVTYKYNNNEYGTDKYGLVVKGVSESSPTNADGKQYEETKYYIKLKITDLAQQASFSSGLSWLLEKYEPTEEEEQLNANLSTIDFIESGTTENGTKTYTASYNGSTLTNNTLYYPSQFGSSNVTTVKEGSNIPVNTNIIIAEGIEEIEDYAFNEKSNVTSVTFQEAGVVTASSNTISKKANLGSLKRIGIRAFYNTSVTKITIPSGIEIIDSLAFGGCKSLTDVTINGGNNCVIGAEAFAYGNATKTITLGEGVIEIGQAAFVRQPINQLTTPSSLKILGAQAFYECKSLTSVKLNEGLTNIGSQTFNACTGLTSIDIPNSVTSIERETFSNCTGLTSIDIPNSLTSIGISAFNSCTSLTSIEIPDSVTSIGISAFENCTGLTSIDIPNNVTSIGGSTFRNCTGLTSIDIPNNVTSIGGSTFRNCTGLTSIVIPSNVTSIGDNAFNSCTGLTSIDIPNSVTSIERETFSNCTSLTSIDIPNSVTSIGISAFDRCNELTEITIPSSVAKIGANAFASCTNVKVLNFNADLSSNPTIVNTYAFNQLGDNVEQCVVFIGDNVTKLTDYLFLDAHGITQVYIPSTTTLGNYVFANTNTTFECCWNGNNIILGGALGSYELSTVNKTRAEFEDALKNPAAKVGDKTYIFIENALKAMNDEITLLKDYTITETIPINNTTTIKAGKDITITCSVDNAFYVYNSLTLGEVGGPTITLKANGITGNIININRGSVILNSAIIDGNNTAKGVIAGNEAEYNADPTNIVCGVQINGGEIKNCVGTEGPAVGIYFGTYFEMTGGKIYSNKSTSSNFGSGVSGAVLIAMGTGNMSGGEIFNNTTTSTASTGYAYGAGVHVTEGATFNMTGGLIKDNKASATYSFGGNVHVAKNSTFNLSGGSIEGDGTNMAMLGGGVANIGTFTMTGGTILNCGAEIGGGVMNIGTATITGGTISGCAAINNASNVSKAIANNGVLNLGNVTLGSGQDISMGYQKVSLASSILPEGYGSLNVTENLTSTYTITFVQVTGTLSASVSTGTKVIEKFTSGTVFATYLNGATADAGDFTTSGYNFYVSNGNVYMQAA